MQIGEFASDYIEVRRDYLDWSPQYRGKADSDSEAPTAAGDRHGVPDVEVTHGDVPMQRIDSKHANGNGNGNGLAPISEKGETKSAAS